MELTYACHFFGQKCIHTFCQVTRPAIPQAVVSGTYRLVADGALQLLSCCSDIEHNIARISQVSYPQTAIIITHLEFILP